MARKLDISQSKYSKIENGLIKLTEAMKEDILRVLETTQEELDKMEVPPSFVFHQQQVENAGQIIHPTDVDAILKIVNEVSAPFKTQIAHLEDEVRFLRNLVERKN